MRVAMAARLRDEGDRRPSVECVFHALIPRRFVVHTHPTTVNALTCANDGGAIAWDLFGDEVPWVPYTDPGLPLAREIDRRRRSGPPMSPTDWTEGDHSASPAVADCLVPTGKYRATPSVSRRYSREKERGP